VALNPDPPIQYPPALFDQQVEGTVVLRLFVDSTGKLSAESTRVSESSGYPALDSAAVAGAGKLQFAPARRHGIPVATVFLQPIEFHHPVTAGAAAPVTPPVVAPKPRPTVRRARPDSTPAHPDTVKPRADTTRADTTQKTDTNAVAH
jgi:TonB family protein